jgi:hypothetical protein
LAGKYYTISAIVDVLVADLKRDGYTMLRTDYDLDDEQFISIVLNVIEKGGWSIVDVDGFHWLGTISLVLI